MKLKLIFLSLIFVLSCGGGKKGVEAFNNITKATMSSNPMIKEDANFTTSSISSKNLKSTSITFENEMHADHMTRIKDFFKLECHMDNVDFCPEGLGHKNIETDPYKLTITTLIGLVYHAIMYGNNIYGGTGYKTCSSGNLSNAPLPSKVPNFGGKENMVIGISNFFDCVSSFKFKGDEDEVNTSYATYYSAASDDAYGVIFSRYNTVSGGYSASSDISQVYASQVGADNNPKLIAANIASYNTMDIRAIIMANTQDNTFVVKAQSNGDHESPDGNNFNLIYAIGKAGVKPNGDWVEGYYLLKSVLNASDDSAAKYFCIKNGVRPEVVSDENCESILEDIDNWSNIDLESYFKITNENDKERLKNFISLLKDGNFLSSNLVPSGHDVFPQTITASE